MRVVFLWMETTGFDPPVRPLQISAIGKYMTEYYYYFFYFQWKEGFEYFSHIQLAGYLTDYLIIYQAWY